MAAALTAHLHYLAMIAIAVILVVQRMLCTPGMAGRQVRLLARLDLLYLGAVVVVLGSGVARVIWFGKGPGFYLYNPAFYIKLACSWRWDCCRFRRHGNTCAGCAALAGMARPRRRTTRFSGCSATSLANWCYSYSFH